GGARGARTRPAPPLPPPLRAQACPELHAEHIFPRLPLQPQQAGVDVPDRRPTREVAPQPAVQPLSDAAVRALGVKAGEQEADLAVDPSPTRPYSGVVARREEDGGGRAARGGATADVLH